MATQNERYSYIEYTCDGTTTTFQIPFDYLDEDDITVFVDGTATTFTFTTSSTVEVTPAPSNNSIVRLRRNTDAKKRAVDFRDGSVLTEADLDNSAIQIFYVAQEAVDLASDSVGVSEDGLIDGQNRKIKDVASPTAADHAVNLGFIQTQYGNVTDVKNNEGNITTVATNITDVITVATNIADVNRIVTSIDNVDDVADNINTLNANYTAINTVATNITDVSNLSGQIANINTVAASFATGNTAPATPNVGDRWFQPSSNALYIWDGTLWYEAAVYSVARRFVYRNLPAAVSFVNGTDSEGNILYVPLNAATVVTVDGSTLVEGDDFTLPSTAQVTFTESIPAGSTIEVRCFNPMLTAEFTEFETMQNTTRAARDSTLTHRNNAETFKNEALTARNVASQEAADAAASEANALAYRDQANTYKTQAQTYSSTSNARAVDAAASAVAAANYAVAAARQDMETGSETNAGLSFVNQPNTGFYKDVNDIGMTVQGQTTARVTPSGLVMESGKVLNAPNRAYGLVQMDTWSNTQSDQNLSTTYVDLRHSGRTFTPKFSNSIIIYEFNWQQSCASTHGIAHYRIYDNGSRQSEWDFTVGGSNYQGRQTAFYRRISWGTTPRELKIMAREYGSNNEVQVHMTSHWDGSGTDNDSASFGRIMEWRS